MDIRKHSWLAILTLLTSLLLSTSTVYANSAQNSTISQNPPGSSGQPFPKGTGKVLPAFNKQKSYTLASMAVATGLFNTCKTIWDVVGVDPSTCPQPKTPFQILTFNTNPDNIFNVSKSTILYLPLHWWDPAPLPPPVPGYFPMDSGCDVNTNGPNCYNGLIGSRESVLNYIFNPTQIGALQFRVWIDGKITVLGSDYVVGVNANPRLVDKTQAYIVTAAFIGNLGRGEHKIGFGTTFVDPSLSYDLKEVYTVNVE